MSIPRLLEITVLESHDSVFWDSPVRATITADSIAGICEVKGHGSGAMCQITMTWRADDVVENENGPTVVRGQGFYLVQETYDEISALFKPYGVMLKDTVKQ